MIIILMGPSGSGKTTIGLALSAATGWRFVDADDVHPAANVEKIRQGTPLTDEDRAPWLAALRAVIEDSVARTSDLIVGCSALRERYRHTLSNGLSNVQWVFLRTPPGVLRERLEQRTGHFAGTAILADQLRTLEEPDDAMVIESHRPVDVVVQEILGVILPDSGP